MKYHDLFVIFEKAAKIEIVFQQLSIYMAVANINIRVILIGEQTNLYICNQNVFYYTLRNIYRCLILLCCEAKYSSLTLYICMK